MEQPGIGHNRPPTPIDPEEVRSAHLAKTAAYEVGPLEAEAAAVPATIPNDEIQGRAQDMLSRARAIVAEIEAARMVAKRPYLAAAATVDAVYHAVMAPFERVVAAVHARCDAYLRAKEAAARVKAQAEAEAARKKLAAEEKRREKAATPGRKISNREAFAIGQRVEAARATVVRAETVATAKPADLARVRGDYGSLGTLQEKWIWSFVGDDPAGVDLEALRPYLARAAIEQAIDAAVRAGVRKLAGVTIARDKQSRIQRRG